MVNNLLIVEEGKLVSNEKALNQYDINLFRTPDGYTSDIAVFTVTSHQLAEYTPPKMKLELMLIKRALLNAEGQTNIESGKWALPGGFVQDDESGFEAAKRELREETGVNNIHIKHLGFMTNRVGIQGLDYNERSLRHCSRTSLANRKASDDAAEVELFAIRRSFEIRSCFRPLRYNKRGDT